MRTMRRVPLALPPATHPALALSLGFRDIVEAMRRVIAVRAARDHAARAVLVLLWGRLGRLAQRLASVAARAADGTLRPDALPAAPRPHRQPRAGARAPDPLPRGFAALARLAPEAAPLRSHLQALLARPEIAAAIAEAPQLARYLRPLCRLLDVAPEVLPPPTLPSRPCPHRSVAPAPPPRVIAPVSPSRPPPIALPIVPPARKRA
jgi:hypothetical protein